MEDRPDTRPEIEPHFWDVTDMKWPIRGKTKPDLIIFDPPAIAYKQMTLKSPFSTGHYRFTLEMVNGQWRAGPPYFKKQADNYDKKAMSGLSKEHYLEFLARFFTLAHQNAKKSTQLAFVNADWPARHRSRPMRQSELRKVSAQARRAGAISRAPPPEMKPGSVQY